MRIVFCGVGALGSHAVLLCRSLPATLVLVDFDRVETKNLAAQAFVKASLGKNKADALRAQLRSLHGVKAESRPVRLTNENVDALCDGADLLVDAVDNLATREVLSGFSRGRRIPLVHAALSVDGTFGLVRWDERFSPDAEDREGQATCEGGEHLPFIGLLSATLARVVQDYVERGIRRDVMVTLTGSTTTAY